MVSIHEIADGVFALTEYLPENRISVSSFLITGESPALIEAGTSYVANGFLRTIVDIVSYEAISHVLVTHEHLDHIGGLPDYVSEAYNATVGAHGFLRAQLGFMGVVWGVKPLVGGERIPLGNREIEVIYAPIETTGTVIYLLKPDGILFSGDYFGQLDEGEWTQYPESSTDELVGEITKLHAGLGYRTEDVKRYLSPLRKRAIKILAPSHGSVIKEDIDKVLNRVINTDLERRKADRGVTRSR